MRNGGAARREGSDGDGWLVRSTAIEGSRNATRLEVSLDLSSLNPAAGVLIVDRTIGPPHIPVKLGRGRLGGREIKQSGRVCARLIASAVSRVGTGGGDCFCDRVEGSGQ